MFGKGTPGSSYAANRRRILSFPQTQGPQRAVASCMAIKMHCIFEWVSSDFTWMISQVNKCSSYTSMEWAPDTHWWFPDNDPDLNGMAILAPAHIREK